jgi:hypothetical protein
MWPVHPRTVSGREVGVHLRVGSRRLCNSTSGCTHASLFGIDSAISAQFREQRLIAKTEPEGVRNVGFAT